MEQITLYDMLNVEPFKFTLREIDEMMDEELSKDPDEMDTEFIDICADILNKAYAEEKNALELKSKSLKEECCIWNPTHIFHITKKVKL